MSSPVAVIDIGSNSIKVLVARRQPDGRLAALMFKTIDARISAGISRVEPRLSPEGMERGLAAVRDLFEAAAAFKPSRTLLVATSAVRDARNGSEFAGRLKALTGEPVRILNGEEEANYIGRGLTCDPDLREARDFHLFDLGGGSLECLTFRERRITQAVSVPLGCVRLTERCVDDPAQPFSEVAQERVGAIVREEIARAGFRFDLPAGAVAVGTGGTVTTARAMLAQRQGRTLENSSTRLSVPELRGLLRETAGQPLAQRREIPALPPARADVFPTALATLLALAELGGFDAYRNSLYNLRWGIADEALG